MADCQFMSPIEDWQLGQVAPSGIVKMFVRHVNPLISPRYVRMAVDTELTSRYVFRSRDAGSEDSVTVGLGRHVINGIDHVCIQHDQQFEYILKMTDGELLAEPNRIGQYRQIDPSQIDYDMIRKWIAHCRGTHGKPCQMLTAKPLRIAKFRLLDCKTETVVDCTELSQYVALSYVLGPSPNVNDKHQDLLSNAVIKDAMRVKFQLGLQYIWVDQLCIDQRDAEDMSCQLSQMNTICMLLTRRETRGLGNELTYC